MTADVVTVTANPAVDQTIWVPGFRAGEVNRVAREQLSPGGKGVNVAAFLAEFGVGVCATGFLGRPNAGLFEAFLDQEGIAHAFVSVPGTTRTGIKIVDEDAGATTDINFAGFEVGDDDLRALEAAVGAATAPGRWVVLAGSLPAGAPADTYRRLAELVHERDGRVALDTSGPALREAMAAEPDLVKPNREELEELTGRRLLSRDALIAAAEELDARTVVVSLGSDGALFSRDGEIAFATPPPVRVASTVGAGDAMVAGTIAGTLRGLELPRVAALATAFSAVAITRIGPHLDASAVEEAARAVDVQSLDRRRTP
jgi:1-phosphofructokinase family hexose kinase